MITEAQLELLRDKYVVWDAGSRAGNMDMRDYHARCAAAMKAALCIIAASPESLGVSQDEPKPSPLTTSTHPRIEGEGEDISSVAGADMTPPSGASDGLSPSDGSGA